MRNIARWVVCAVALSSSAVFADAAADQTAAAVRAELQKIDARLKLSADQKAKLKDLIQERIEKGDALNKEYKGKMRDVLTPAQQTEWDKIKSEYRTKAKAAH